MTLQVGHQLRPRSSRRRGETIMKWDIMRRNNLGIWKNIGKIVILIFQIIHEQVKWTIRSFKRVKRVNPKVEKYSDRRKGSYIKTKDDITFI